MKKTAFIIGGVLIALAIVILALKPFSKKENSYSFETVKVQKGTISNTVTATGTIQAIKSIAVGTQVYRESSSARPTRPICERHAWLRGGCIKPGTSRPSGRAGWA